MTTNFDYITTQGRVSLTNAYRLYPVSAPLNQWIEHFWLLDVPEGNYCYRSLPDNCVDWITNVNCPEYSYLIAPFMSSIVFDLHGPCTYLGIRFRLLGQHGLIREPVGSWGNHENGLLANELVRSDLLAQLQDNIGKANTFDDICERLSGILLMKMCQNQFDKRLVRYMGYCQQNISSRVSLSNRQCAEFGLSSRQLRRLSQLYLGVSPRDFARVIRFQQTLRVMNSCHNATNWMTYYYDQSHFIKEFKLLSGLTPTAIMNLSVLYNNDIK
ncbi:DUF6597 domain-containing transcriptional factor [Aliikangiella maris]|uniref:Helix-turn-helix domain-containing protein n=2 Tax=Aliikangiella maris TaxID=3162458 RepID=A0ABV3MP05_9GAMM